MVARTANLLDDIEDLKLAAVRVLDVVGSRLDGFSVTTKTHRLVFKILPRT